MSKILARYLASSFIPPFLLALTFFIAFLIIFFMFRIIGIIIYKGIDILTVLTLIFDLGISFIPLATPLASFFATIYTLNKLSEDSEIIAMRSFGMPKTKIYLPFFIVSLLIALTTVSLHKAIIPNAVTAFHNNMLKVTTTGMISNINSGKFFSEIPNLTLYAEDVSESGNNFNKLFLHVLSNDKSEQRIIFAQSGSLIRIFADSVHPPGLRLHLIDGNILKMNSSGKQIEKILFKEYDFPIFNPDTPISELHYDTMKTNVELLKHIQQKKINYSDSLPNKKSAHDILELKKTLYRTQSEYYARFVNIPQIILFIFLGFSMGIKRGRGSGGSNSLKAFVMIVGYYLLYYYFLSLAHASVLNPVIAIYGPSLIFFIITFKFYKKLDWIN